MNAALLPVKRAELAAVARGLRALRLAHALTQKEFGRRAGLSASTVAHWERRAPPVIWARLARIADALGVSADEVLGRVPVTPVVDALSRQDRELLDAMRDDVIALLGPEYEQRLGGWRTVAREKWLGHLIGARDRLLERSDSNAPMIEAASAQQRTRVWAVKNGKPYGRRRADVAPQPSETPVETGDGKPYERLYPKDYYTGWESPRQEALRKNLPAPPVAPRQLTAKQAATKRKLLKEGVVR